MNVKTIITLIFIAITMSSCKKYYDYNANYDGNKLVVNGIIEANIGVTVALSQSQSPSGIIPLQGFNIKNGRVWLYQNDTLVAEMTRNSKGKYIIHNFKPQSGKAYHIKAIADDLDTVESHLVIMPQAPTINSFVLKKDNSYAMNQGYSGAFFSVNLQDISNDKNYYLLNGYVQINSDSIHYFVSYVPHDYESCEFNGGGIVSFTDKCFNGKSFILDYITEHTNKGVWKVQLSSIDKNFFTYLHNVEQPTGLERAFAEPKLTVSNIKNGYGILVAKNTVTFSLKLD